MYTLVHSLSLSVQELDIDHIIGVITTELREYGSVQMVSDFKHCKRCHPIEGLNAYFESKSKSCTLYDDVCHILERKDHEKEHAIGSSDEYGDGEEIEHQRTSTFARMKPHSLKFMRVLDDYHCYFLHKMDEIRAEQYL